MLDIHAFEEFLDPERLELLERILSEVNSLDEVRKTATGRITAAGSVPLPGVMEVISALSDTDPNQMLKMLTDDANGTKVFPLVEREAKKNTSPRKRKEKKPLVFSIGEGKGFVQPMTVNGENLLASECEEQFDREGNRFILFRLLPVWLFKPGEERFTWNIRLLVPNIKKVSMDGHHRVGFRERQERFFRPRFVWENDTLTKEEIHRYFAMALFDTIKELPNHVSMRTVSSSKRVEEVLNRAVARALVALPMQDDMAELVMRFEFEVVIKGSKNITSPTGERTQGSLGITEKWRMREKALKLLVEEFDINCTSKNHPGDIITKRGLNGLPSFITVINPFSVFMDKKREPEMREIRKCLELSNPTPLSVRALGFHLPDVLANRMRELTVAVFDCPFNFHDGDNLGEDFCHDTLLALPSFMEKMKILRQRFEFVDPEEMEEMKTRLAEMGVGSDSIEETTIRRDLDNGMFMNIWRLDVRLNKEDLGKVKSLGAIKGVPSLMKFRLFAVEPDGSRKEIDLVIPESTFRKKKCLDAMLYMMAAKAGVSEVNPTEMTPENLPNLVRGFQEEMEKKGFRSDMKQEVILVHENGDEERMEVPVVVGVLPFYRPVQTGFGQFRTRGMGRGMNIHLHDLQMLDLKHTVTRQAEKRFAQLVQATREVGKIEIEGMLNDPPMTEEVLYMDESEQYF